MQRPVLHLPRSIMTAQTARDLAAYVRLRSSLPAGGAFTSSLAAYVRLRSAHRGQAAAAAALAAYVRLRRRIQRLH